MGTKYLILILIQLGLTQWAWATDPSLEGTNNGTPYFTDLMQTPGGLTSLPTHYQTNHNAAVQIFGSNGNRELDIKERFQNNIYSAMSNEQRQKFNIGSPDQISICSEVPTHSAPNLGSGVVVGHTAKGSVILTAAHNLHRDIGEGFLGRAQESCRNSIQVSIPNGEKLSCSSVLHFEKDFDMVIIELDGHIPTVQEYPSIQRVSSVKRQITAERPVETRGMAPWIHKHYDPQTFPHQNMGTLFNRRMVEVPASDGGVPDYKPQLVETENFPKVLLPPTSPTRLPYIYSFGFPFNREGVRGYQGFAHKATVNTDNSDKMQISVVAESSPGHSGAGSYDINGNLEFIHTSGSSSLSYLKEGAVFDRNRNCFSDEMNNTSAQVQLIPPSYRNFILKLRAEAPELSSLGSTVDDTTEPSLR